MQQNYDSVTNKFRMEREFGVGEGIVNAQPGQTTVKAGFENNWDASGVQMSDYVFKKYAHPSIASQKSGRYMPYLYQSTAQ